jgi:hypothetical protein
MEYHFHGRQTRLLLWIPVLLAVSLTVFLAACSPISEPAAQGEGQRDECGFVEPSQAEVDKTLSFKKEVFNPEEWLKSYSVEPYKISVSRQNEVESSIAYVEYLIYNCGYGQNELAEYFNDEGFNIVFAGYEAHNLAAFCEQESLALYKFELLDEGAEYAANYWVKQEDDTHVLVVMLVFPRESSAQLDEYSRKIFPDLTSCQQ